jgi:hypothetical protein
MAEATGPDDLSGLWHGQYSYPVAKPPVAFVANLIDTGETLGGSITETCEFGPKKGFPLYATVHGTHRGTSVVFTKTYEVEDAHYGVVRYSGAVNAEGTEIEGTWTTQGWSGRFLMIRTIGVKTDEKESVTELA